MILCSRVQQDYMQSGANTSMKILFFSYKMVSNRLIYHTRQNWPESIACTPLHPTLFIDSMIQNYRRSYE